MENRSIFAAFFFGKLIGQNQLDMAMCMGHRIMLADDIPSSTVTALLHQSFESKDVIDMAHRFQTDKDFREQCEKRLDAILMKELLNNERGKQNFIINTMQEQ